MKGLGLLFLISSCWTAAGHAAECDEFVSLVAPAKTSYQKEHRIYPVPDAIKALAQRYMPRLWVHPQSWHPISFEDYLDRSRLIRKSDGHVLRVRPSIHSLSALDFANQRATYLKSEEITPFIDDLRNTDWRAIVYVMRGRLADAILNHPVQH